jgi:hypothetical protein
VKNWIFDDLFHKKGPVLVILVPGVIKPSVLWENRTVEVDEASEISEAAEINEAAVVSKA